MQPSLRGSIKVHKYQTRWYWNS